MESSDIYTILDGYIAELISSWISRIKFVEKNCRVEKVQFSIYANCGEIENFSTCGKFWEIMRNFGKFWVILPQFMRFRVEQNWAQK